MYVDPMEMCRAERFSNKQCVKYLGLPWNINMVAAMNNTTDSIVKEGLRANRSLVRQLQTPYAHNTSRDLNKRSEKPIAMIAGVPWSWRFVDYIEYAGSPSNYGVYNTKPRGLYQYHLTSNGLENTGDVLVAWLIDYACKSNLRLDNARFGRSNETLQEAIRAMYASYQKFDKNKLRRTTGTLNYVKQPEDPELRKYYILERYINVVHMLPAEHVKEAVTTMLNHRGVEWLKHLQE